MKIAMPSLLESFLYPLKIGNIVVILVMTFIGTFLFITLRAALADFGTGYSYLLFTMGLIAFLPFINTLFEYGLDIIESSANGKLEPPLIGYSTIKGKRFLKQAVMLEAFFGTGQVLIITGHQYIGDAILIFISLALPAGLVIHSLYDDFYKMINPMALSGMARTLGPAYFLSIVPLAIITLLINTMMLAGLVQILLLMAGSLYLLLCFFCYLGKCVYLKRSVLVKPIDFAAESKEAAEIQKETQGFNKLMLKTYELVRAGQVEKAEGLLLTAAAINSWERFNKIFSICSKWDNKKPVLTLAGKYSSELIQKEDYLQALDLCGWALKQDSMFSLIENSDIRELSLQAASKEHYHTVINLVENFVEVSSGRDKPGNLLFLAADICKNKIRDQKLYEKFMSLLEEFDEELFLKVSEKSS